MVRDKIQGVSWKSVQLQQDLWLVNPEILQNSQMPGQPSGAHLSACFRGKAGATCFRHQVGDCQTLTGLEREFSKWNVLKLFPNNQDRKENNGPACVLFLITSIFLDFLPAP